MNKLWDNQSAFFTYCSLSPLFILLFSLRWWTHRPIQAYQRQPLAFLSIYIFPIGHFLGSRYIFIVVVMTGHFPSYLHLDIQHYYLSMYFSESPNHLHRTFPFPKKEKCIVLSETCFNQKLETSSIHTKHSLWLVPRGLRSLRIYFDKTFLSASIRQSAMFFSPCYLTLVRLFPSCLDLIPR